MDVKIKRGQILKDLRESNKLSQKQLAIMLGTSHQAYQKYEYGTAEPTFDNLSKLADFYGVSTDYLLGRDETTNLLKQPYTDIDITEEAIADEYLKLPAESRQVIISFLKNALKNAAAKEQAQAKMKTAPIERTEKTYSIPTAAHRGYNDYFSGNAEDMTESEVQQLLNAEDADEDL